MGEQKPMVTNEEAEGRSSPAADLVYSRMYLLGSSA